MAKHSLKNCYITVAGVNISDHCSSVTIDQPADEVDVTGFGASGTREYVQGLKDATITLEVFQDFAASSIDQTLYPYYASGGTFAVVVRPDASASVGTTNPQYSMDGRLFNYTPLDGAVGDANTTTIEIRNGGTAGITRATS